MELCFLIVMSHSYKRTANRLETFGLFDRLRPPRKSGGPDLTCDLKEETSGRTMTNIKGHSKPWTWKTMSKCPEILFRAPNHPSTKMVWPEEFFRQKTEVSEESKWRPGVWRIVIKYRYHTLKDKKNKSRNIIRVLTYSVLWWV